MRRRTPGVARLIDFGTHRSQGDVLRRLALRGGVDDGRSSWATRAPARAITGASAAAPGSACGLVGLEDRLRDAAAVADLVAVLTRPLPDRMGFLAV